MTDDWPEETYTVGDKVVNIVTTPDTLGGSPRVEGHRIAVSHIVSMYRSGNDPAEIAGEGVYPTLSVEQVQAALHYASDRPDAVRESSRPRDTPLKLETAFDSQAGGPKLAAYDVGDDDRGAVAEVVLSIDDLPDDYDVQDLLSAWHWMYSPNEEARRLQSSLSQTRRMFRRYGGLGDAEGGEPTSLDDARDRIQELIDSYSQREGQLSSEEESKLQAYRDALATINGDGRERSDLDEELERELARLEDDPERDGE